VHFVESSFRPAFFGHGGFDFLTEGFDALWIGKKAVQRLRERLTGKYLDNASQVVVRRYNSR